MQSANDLVFVNANLHLLNKMRHEYTQDKYIGFHSPDDAHSPDDDDLLVEENDDDEEEEAEVESQDEDELII